MELLVLLVGQRRPGVLENRHVRTDLAEQQRLVHGHRARREHADAPVADLPAVAVEAVQHIGSPPLGEARDVGQLVAQAGRHQDTAGGDHPVADLHTEAILHTP